jgi:hypothetical protein
MCQASLMSREEIIENSNRACPTCNGPLDRWHKKYCSHECHSIGMRIKDRNPEDEHDPYYATRLACDLHLADLANVYEFPEPAQHSERPVVHRVFPDHNSACGSPALLCAGA